MHFKSFTTIFNNRQICQYLPCTIEFSEQNGETDVACYPAVLNFNISTPAWFWFYCNHSLKCFNIDIAIELKNKKTVCHGNLRNREQSKSVYSYDDSSSEYAPLIGWHFGLIFVLVCDWLKRSLNLRRWLILSTDDAMPKPIFCNLFELSLLFLYFKIVYLGQRLLHDKHSYDFKCLFYRQIPFYN